MGKQWKQWLTLFFWAPKSLQMVIAAMKLKDTYSLEGKLWLRVGHDWSDLAAAAAAADSILKSRDFFFANKGPSSQGYGFSSGHVWMWE